MEIAKATSFGGPFIMLPRRLAKEWEFERGPAPDPESGLYGEVCSRDGYLHVIEFRGNDVLRIAEMPDDIYWIPEETGGVVIQWNAAESLEQLIEFGREVSRKGDWEERIEFRVVESELRIMDSCGFEGDGQPKIELWLSPGSYQASAAYSETENTWATVFRFERVR